MNEKLDMMIRYRDQMVRLQEVVKAWWDIWEEPINDETDLVCEIQAIAEKGTPNMATMSLDEWWHELFGVIENLNKAIKEERNKLPVPLKAEDFANYDGSKVTLGGQEFEFYLDGDLAGTWNIFDNDDFRILATVNYDCRGVPINIEEPDGLLIESFFVEAEVKDFDQYLEIVKEQIDSYFRDIGANSFDDLKTVEVVVCNECAIPADFYKIEENGVINCFMGCRNPECKNHTLDRWEDYGTFETAAKHFHIVNLRKHEAAALKRKWPYTAEY